MTLENEVSDSAIIDKPHDGVFNTKSEAEKWISHCVVRWIWVIGMVEHIDPATNELVAKPRVRKIGGSVLDTTKTSYVKDTCDEPMNRYVTITKQKDGTFKVLNKG